MVNFSNLVCFTSIAPRSKHITFLCEYFSLSFLMSAPPKRSHEEGGHSSAPKYPHDDSGTYPKIAPGVVSNEYHSPYDMSQDARGAKISRDADRKSPLQSVYRMPSASNDFHVDNTHPVSNPDSRPVSRDAKDSRDHRIDHRDQRPDARDMYSDSTRDPQSVKPEKDVRLESRADGNKETKHERETRTDHKYQGKLEKDVMLSASGQMAWQESKESQRGKRYTDTPNRVADAWHASRSNPQGPPEIAKEGQTFDVRERPETHDTVGESKVDSKSEDRSKDKDRKRKDVKYREWGDKEKHDRRPNFQLGNSSVDVKDSTREEREQEKWQRERKDIPKDLEKPKDHTKRESWNGVDKESIHNDKDIVDGSARVPESENTTLEQRKTKDSDAWKNIDRDSRERRKERDADIAGDRPDKRIRLDDKDSVDGFPNGEGGTERERESEAFNFGVQQRKRMMRSRGSPQVANREPRFNSVTQENEGFQGMLLPLPPP
ncbi:hypothetical protein LINGRAHAP2_LOCUS30356 [Linum grandiflorum]